MSNGAAAQQTNTLGIGSTQKPGLQRCMIFGWRPASLQPAANHGYGGIEEGLPENAAAAEAAYADSDSLSAFSEVNVHNASTF
jgi:hypothetical protein